MLRMRRRPPRMKPQAWIEFNRMHPVFRCIACGETDEEKSSVDRIVPGADGGEYVPSNCQWLCRPCNSRKGPRSDAYWGQLLPFDRPLDLSALRFGQRNGCFDQILSHADYFTRPWSELAGYIHLMALIVGSGKTYIPPIAAHALNHVIRRDCGLAYPRADRILIATKERQIRDQIARDLRENSVRLGILPVAPRVGIIGDPSSHMLEDLGGLASNDIWVTCTAMFFEKNHRHRENLPEIFSWFPLIFFDEPHCASDQVLSMLRHAYASLCFGLTGSPIDGAGEILKKYFLFSLFDYANANDLDRSVKLVVPPTDADGWREQVEVIPWEGARIGEGDGEREAVSCEEEGYDLNIRPAISVAERVIACVAERDLRYTTAADGPWKRAAHRPADAVVDLVYPSHALIQVGSIKEGELLVTAINRIFDTNRAAYPRKAGYHAMLVHGGGKDDEGKAGKGLPLKPDHPWFWSYDNGGRLSEKACRFLVVVYIGREGMNNPFTNIVGVAASADSMVEVVQRHGGRQIRSVHAIRDGRLHVPPEELDRIKIITHPTYGNEGVIGRGLGFILDMAGHLADLPTIDRLIEGDAAVADPPRLDPDPPLTPAEKMGLTDLIGRLGIGAPPPPPDESGDPPPPPPPPLTEEELVRLWCGDDAPDARKRRARNWVQTVRTDPSSAKIMLGLDAVLEEVPRVLWEDINVDPTPDELFHFIRVHKPGFVVDLARLGDPFIRKVLVEFYRDHYKQFRLAEIPSAQTTSGVQRRVGYKIIGEMGVAFAGEKARVFKLTGTAIKKVLGCQPPDTIADGGRFDTPECHAILDRPEVQRKIIGWVKKSLIEGGDMPTIAAALRIDPDALAADSP